DTRSRQAPGAVAAPGATAFDAETARGFSPLRSEKRPLDSVEPAAAGTGAVLAAARLAGLDDFCGDIAEDDLTTVLRDRINDHEGAGLHITIGQGLDRPARQAGKEAAHQCKARQEQHRHRSDQYVDGTAQHRVDL